ncbi:MAG: hypothetical protein HZB55_10695 [Deltaproteobacteria bacterium]|nr:hypothetical protein [Deltaproteobacteria bacterium]
MSRAVYAGFGRLLAEDLPAFAADVEALAGLQGAVFLDPEDGLSPVLLAMLLRRAWPSARVILPLVARDANRTALLGAARTAEALGADGLLLLSGRLDPARVAQTVYEVDPQQLLGVLRESGVVLPCWVSSRCATAAERARVESLGRAGAACCVVPWSSEDAGDACVVRPPVYSVAESDWAAGRLPPGEGDLLLHVTPGRGAAAAAVVEVGGLS